MGKYDDIKEKIMKTPTANDITPKQIQNFLIHYGFTLKRSNGSHYIYSYTSTDHNYTLVIPMHNPIKQAYIDEIRKRIIEIEEK